MQSSSHFWVAILNCFCPFSDVWTGTYQVHATWILQAPESAAPRLHVQPDTIYNILKDMLLKNNV